VSKNSLSAHSRVGIRTSAEIYKDISVSSTTQINVKTSANVVLSKFIESHEKVGFKTNALLVTGVELNGTTRFGIKTRVGDIHKRTFKNQPQKYKQSQPIYLFDKNERMRLVLSDNTIRYTNGKIITEYNGESAIEFDVISKHPDIRYIQNEARAVAQDNEGNWREFIIRKIEDVYDGPSAKEVYGEGGEYELSDEWLNSYVQPSVNLPNALGAILQGTRFEVGEVEDKYSVQSVELKRMSKRKAINELIEQWGGEVKYRIETDGERITRRFVDVLEPKHKPISHTFLSRRDITSASRVSESREIKTALYGYGAADENGDRLTFADVEWSVANGDPVDKPKGQAWVGDHEAMEKWGARNGTKHKRGGYDGQEEDAATLLLNTWNALQEQFKLRDTYDVDAVDLGALLGLDHRNIKTGALVNVFVDEVQPPIETQAGIVRYDHNLNDDRKSECVIGDFRLELNTEEKLEELDRDWNESKGVLAKRPIKYAKTEADKVRKVAEENLRIANENIEKAKKDLEESMEKIEIGKDKVIGLDEELDDLDHAISNKIPIGMAAKDVNEGNTKILGKSLVVDGNATFTGRIGASRATFVDVGTENMVAKNATIESGVITGTFDSPQAVIRRATFEDVVVSGRLDSATGNFAGSVNTEENLYVGNMIVLGDTLGGNKLVDFKYGRIQGDVTGLYVRANDGDLNLSSGADRVLVDGELKVYSASGGSSHGYITTDSSDGYRVKIGTSNDSAQIWMDRNGTIYFLNNGSVVHKFYSSGDYFHAGEKRSS